MVCLGLICFTLFGNDPTSIWYIHMCSSFTFSETMPYLSNPSPSKMWASCAGGMDALDTLPMSPECASAAAAAAAARSPEQSLSPTMTQSERQAQYQQKDNSKKAEAMQVKSCFMSFKVILAGAYRRKYNTSYQFYFMFFNAYTPGIKNPPVTFPPSGS